MELAGRIALVSGASRGLGRAIALELAARGADLIVAARSVDHTPEGVQGTLLETADAVRGLGREAYALRVDLGDVESLPGFVASALDWRGRIDVLVNNAAFLGRAAFHSLEQVQLSSWNRQLTVNLTAPMLLTQQLAPAMREQGGGVIVNVTSESALIAEYPYPGIAYGTTKAALNRMTPLLARHLRADGIAVFAVDPGYTRTAIAEEVAGEAGLDIERAHPASVPTGLIADLIEADIDVTTGRIFRAVQGKGPVLIADGNAPLPEGIEISLPPREESS